MKTTRDEFLVAAGMVAAQKWDIDLAKVNIIFTSSLEPFKVDISLLMVVQPPQETISMLPSDYMIFESYNGAHWCKDDFKFWLAWGPITNTLAIYIDESKKNN